jgi:alpha-L-rhamnosidase
MKFVILISYCMLTTLLANAFDQPQRLSVENKAGEVAVDTRQPVFGWIIASETRGFKQGSWEIQVASDKANLLHGNADVWDSKQVNDSRQNFVKYKGTALESAKRYFWRVRVWPSSGTPSKWSEPATFITALLDVVKWRDAKWIAFEELDPAMKVFPGIHMSGDQLGDKGLKRAVIPLFRKPFLVKKKVKAAYLFVSGLGQYEAVLNGKKVGSDFLAPGWTNYEKRSLYNAFDVTKGLQSGENVIGAIVGTGFRYINRERYRKMVIAEAFPMLRLILMVHYTDGSVQEIKTDDTWKTAPSPITFSSIYGGEDYDANLETPAWASKDFSASLWKDVKVVEGPHGKMSIQNDYPLRVMETFDVKQIKSLGRNKFLYDFGQNASGIIRLNVRGKKGDKIRVTPAEVLDDKGLPYQKASGAPYYFNYTLKGGEKETWEPRFSYYGFRYALVEIESDVDWNSDRAIRVQLLHTRNSSPTVGAFECSNPLLNQVNELIKWGIKSNMASVATDCPHREKLGWLEQTHLIGSSLKYNFDIQNLYNKIIDDMIEGQLPNGLVPDIVPEYVPFDGGFRDSPEWGSASIIIPWYLYQWYGDSTILRKAYPMMKRYLSYLGTKADKNILSHGLGDWFDLGPKNPGVSQLTPIALTATATYFYDADLLSKIAKVIGKDEDASMFIKQAGEIKTAFNQKFLNAKTAVYATGSQTSYAMPLYMGLVDAKLQKRVFENLVDSIRASNKALTAGDVGYRYLLRALEENGGSQLIYEMNNRNDVPGYGYQIKHGATALTESWPALKYVSNNHMMLGHLMEWLYSGLAGIKQQEGDFGFKKVAIEPEMVDGLDWLKATYGSINGDIKVHWLKNGKNNTVSVSIPANTTAQIILPASDARQVEEGGHQVGLDKNVRYAGKKGKKAIFDVGSGDYTFTFN